MKKTIKIFFALTLAAFAGACTPEVDDVFDDQSAIRIEKAISECDDVLKSAPNGWLMEYYGEADYGGYNVICKFNGDNTVTVANEVYADGSATTHYKLEQSQGVLLSFDEYNKYIHLFSEPKNPFNVGSAGTGFGGDFEFRVISATQDTVKLGGKKHGSRIIMTPLAPDADWDEYCESAAVTEANMSWSTYYVVIGDKQYMLAQSYRTFTYTDEAGQPHTWPYIVTPEGIKFHDPVELDGETFSYFKYSEDHYVKDKYDQDVLAWYDESNANCYLTYEITPPSILLYQKGFYMSPEGASEDFLAAFEAAKSGSASEGEKIGYFYLGPNIKDSGSAFAEWGFQFWSGGYVGAISFLYESSDNYTVTLTPYKTGGNGGYYYNKCGYNTVISLLKGTFTLSVDNDKNPSWIRLTNAANPDSYVTVYANEIDYPFE